MYTVRISNLRLWILNIKYILDYEITLSQGHVPVGSILSNKLIRKVKIKALQQ